MNCIKEQVYPPLKQYLCPKDEDRLMENFYSEATVLCVRLMMFYINNFDQDFF